MRGKKRGLALLAVALTMTTPAWAVDVEVEAVIISRSENNLTVRTRQGNLTVVVSGDTRIRETSGAFQRRTRGPETLIPGLIIEVEGDQQGETVTAENIQYKERDWRSAIATRAGTTEQFAQQGAQLSELRRAIIEGNEYVIRDEVIVYFDTGSANIASAHQLQLRQLAENAASHGNYRISIIGFADSRGNPAANERLSLRRAMAVSNFLRQTGSIQPGRVLSPTAMGEGTTIPGVEPPANDDEARRVLVRVVTPQTQLTQ